MKGTDCKKLKSGKVIYKGLRYGTVLCTVLSLVALFAVIIFVLKDGVGKINLNLLFGKYSSRKPTLLPAFCGTLSLVAIASVIAVPTGVFTAIFLVEYMNNKGKIVKTIRLAAETLAGIPSIVYGLFGYLIFVSSFGWGYSLLGGGITLAIMILPVIIRSAEESLLAVSDGLREGSYALGASKVRTIFKIVLPTAAGGIITSVILAIGRVVSESAVLILTIGMVVNLTPASVLSPGTSLALDIYYFYSHGFPDEAAATSVVLLVFVLALNLIAGGIGKAIKRKRGEK